MTVRITPKGDVLCTSQPLETRRCVMLDHDTPPCLGCVLQKVFEDMNTLSHNVKKYYPQPMTENFKLCKTQESP